MLVDLTINHLATAWEVRNGVGDHWWMSVLQALTGAGRSGESENATPQIDPKNIRWM